MNVCRNIFANNQRGTGVGQDNNRNEISRQKLVQIIKTCSKYHETTKDVEVQAALKR